MFCAASAHNNSEHKGEEDRGRFFHIIPLSIIDKLRKNKPLNTTTINDLCRILDCPVESIMVYVPSDKDQVL